MILKCPQCGSDDVHHSRPRSWAEQLRGRLTGRTPFRCHACDWRGWRREPGVHGEPLAHLREIHPDLTDAELERLELEQRTRR